HCGDLSNGELLIENIGEVAAEFLDITVRCYVGLKGPTLPLYLTQFQGAILESKTNVKVPYNFRPQLSAIPGIEQERMMYMFFIVASDRSERIIETYKYNPIVNKVMMGNRRPLRILWQQRPSVWRPLMKLRDWVKW
ncbi:MAG TPA: hypothetical protein VHA14_12895, partial [Bryobacteraceae bacterium]|nr:hypothetical protein [Bryobacteraceae bacterium]